MLPPSKARPPIRWWPALLVLALLGLFWVYVWVLHPGHRQEKNLMTMSSFGLALFLLFLWALTFSRLRVRTRLILLGSVLVLGLVASQTIRVRGVTGDFIPVFQWRWTQAPAPLLPRDDFQPSSPRMQLDYAQFLGPEGTGVVPGPGLVRDWAAEPPVELWRQPVGPAWAGFAIFNNYAITLEQAGEQELTTCRDLLTGSLLWTHADNARFATVIAGEGPRTVPTIRSNRVYTVGATGNLNCLNLTNGAVLWSKNILTDAKASMPDWGVSGSPLVTDEMVVVSPGGGGGQSLVAYHAQTGDRVWAGGNSRADYSSPVPAVLAGVPQILSFNGQGVTAHDHATGEVLWEYGWRGGHPHVANPLVLSGDRVLVSSGYGTGSELLEVSHPSSTNWTVKRLWKSIRLKSKFANLIHHNDYIYGLDDGMLVCLDLATGQLQWKGARYGHGQIILVRDVLLIMAESGDVVLVEPSPMEPRELTRFKVLSGKTWNPPALAGPYLLVRNDREAACFQLPTQPN